MQVIRYKHNTRLLVVMLLCLLLLTSCGAKEEETIAAGVKETDHQLVFELTKEDQREEMLAPIEINLDNEKDQIVITQGGDYHIQGTLQGKILVRAEEQIVHLFLDNARVDAVKGSALVVEEAGKVILTAMKDTINAFSDTGVYEKNEEMDACIYSNPDITLNGEGRIQVYGKYKNGIHTKDKLKVLNCDLSCQAKKDCLKGNDGVAVISASLQLEAEEDGIHTTKTGKDKKGSVEIYQVMGSVIAGKYGLEVADDLVLASPDCYIKGIWSNTKVAGSDLSPEE